MKKKLMAELLWVMAERFHQKKVALRNMQRAVVPSPVVVEARKQRLFKTDAVWNAGKRQQERRTCRTVRSHGDVKFLLPQRLQKAE